MATPDGAQVGRCDEHDDVAYRYSDGSTQCWFCLVVETGCRCGWLPLPIEWTEPPSPPVPPQGGETA